jgi:hypothetical protein
LPERANWFAKRTVGDDALGPAAAREGEQAGETEEGGGRLRHTDAFHGGGANFGFGEDGIVNADAIELAIQLVDVISTQAAPDDETRAGGVVAKGTRIGVQHRPVQEIRDHTVVVGRRQVDPGSERDTERG